MTYTAALIRGREIGARRCDDAAAMALFCDHLLQILVGAVSPRLVWEGAQAKGLTFLGLTRLCHDDPVAVADLQWERT